MNNFGKIGAIVLLLLTTTVSYGQRTPAKDKIKTLKIAFITERLNLSSEEAQTFWPIYNDHETKIEALRKKERIEMRGKLGYIETLSDKEVNDLLDAYIAMEEERNKLNRAFFEELRNVISAKKTFMLIKAEKDFKKRLIKQIQQRRQKGER